MATETFSQTSKRYLYVDSGDFNDSFDTDDQLPASYSIRLLDPIHNAHGVSLLSMIMPNELRNISWENNSFTLVRWKSQTGPIDYLTRSIYPGQYTVDKLLLAVNAEIYNAWGTFRYPDLSIAEHPTITGANLVTFGMTIDTRSPNLDNAYDRYAIILPQSSYAFKNSIWYRLGFKHSQILSETNGQYSISQLDEYYTKRPDLVILDTATTPDIRKYALHQGTEIFDNMFVHLDLIAGHIMRTQPMFQNHAGGLAVSDTSRTDLLAVVPLNGNVGAAVSWTRPTDNHMQMPINGRKPVDNLTLTFTDDRNQPFSRRQFPGFSLVIEFTVVEHIDKLGEMVAQANQRSAFLSRHMPMQLT